MPASGSRTSWASQRWAMITAKVGGAMTSAYPAAWAASGSTWKGCSPATSANSRIFSRPTSYGGVGGYVRPANEALTMRAPGWDGRRAVRRRPPLRAGVAVGRVRASAGLAVHGVPAVPTAVLLHLEPVGVVAAVLPRDVVPLLALHARQRDLRADVGALGGHGTALSRCGGGALFDCCLLRRSRGCLADLPWLSNLVAGAGLEPATPRL